MNGNSKAIIELAAALAHADLKRMAEEYQAKKSAIEIALDDLRTGRERTATDRLIEKWNRRRNA